MSDFQTQIEKRRTFAIISHPDAGKTTITEKLLLFGGAIQQAGAIKAKKVQKYTTSDWMELEKQRGVSVSTSVMSFEHQGAIVNLLDTPGHADFGEDTYRTLTAVDSVLMVIDSVKGVESRTKKLMDVCKMKRIPVITFINKLDREGRDPFDLLDDLESNLGITAIPLSWPISMGKTFKGVYNIQKNNLLSFQKNDKNYQEFNSEQIEQVIGQDNYHKLQEDLSMIQGALPPFDRQQYLKGEVTPVFFGSAINNFGVYELLESIISLAPAPQSNEAEERVVSPQENKMTGIIFKIHANMNPKHRDRIAFMRINSGKFTRGMKTRLVRLGREIKIANPMTFLARSREITEEAYPGDIIGIHDTGLVKIGDTFTEGEDLHFTGIPSFAPEIFRRVVNKDPQKHKQLQKGLEQLSEEGAVQLFKRTANNELILGAVGVLQFDVVRFRLENEYGAKCDYEPYNAAFAYWVRTDDQKQLSLFESQKMLKLARDNDGQLVYLFEGSWEVKHVQDSFKDINFYRTSECQPERDLVKV